MGDREDPAETLLATVPLESPWVYVPARICSPNIFSLTCPWIACFSSLSPKWHTDLILLHQLWNLHAYVNSCVHWIPMWFSPVGSLCAIETIQLTRRATGVKHRSCNRGCVVWKAWNIECQVLYKNHWPRPTLSSSVFEKFYNMGKEDSGHENFSITPRFMG